MVGARGDGDQGRGPVRHPVPRGAHGGAAQATAARGEPGRPGHDGPELRRPVLPRGLRGYQGQVTYPTVRSDQRDVHRSPRARPPFSVECVASFASSDGFCGKFRVTWAWAGSSANTTVRIQFVLAPGVGSCVGDCATPEPQSDAERCAAAWKDETDHNWGPPFAGPVTLAEVDAAVGAWEGFGPSVDGYPCVWVVARNAVGSSPLVFAADVTKYRGPLPPRFASH